MLAETSRCSDVASAGVSGGRAPLRFIDLFAGIGGLRLGFERGVPGASCVFTSEWNKFAQQTYRANFPDDAHPIHGDIRDALDSVPEHDVLLAGFPCQPFSIAGVSKKNSLGRPHGFACETQGTLFFEVAKILERHRPRAFILENVKNLKSHDRGNTFRVIMQVLRQDLGYHCDEPLVIDAQGFVPQHRERVFIVGFREPHLFRFDSERVAIPSPKSGPALRTILHPEDGSESPDGRYTLGDEARVHPRYTLTDKLWSYLQGYAAKHQAKGNGFGYGLASRDGVTRTLSARYYKDGSEILVPQSDSRNPRRLTPRECARLMGFERDGRTWNIPVSDTQAYRQFGNSVVVPVVEAVARGMRLGLEGIALEARAAAVVTGLGAQTHLF